jgi:Fe-S cluster assembly iron-binding protein IscA
MSGLKLTTHKGTTPAPSATETDAESDIDFDEPSAPPLDLATIGPDYFLLSDAAVARLSTQRAAQGPAHGLRVIVDTGGCSGFQYQFHPAQLPLPPTSAATEDVEPRVTRSDDLPDEVVFRRGGAAVAVDAVSLPFLKGSTLDYKTELIRAGFAVIDNPNVDLACGCGTSFSRKGAK